MNIDEWPIISGFVGIVGFFSATVWRIIARVDKGDENVLEAVSNVETRYAAAQAKADLDFAQFREAVGKEFVRRTEHDLSQKNIERRLDNIEQTLGKFPETIRQQTAELISVIRDHIKK